MVGGVPDVVGLLYDGKHTNPALATGPNGSARTWKVGTRFNDWCKPQGLSCHAYVHTKHSFSNSTLASDSARRMNEFALHTLHQYTVILIF